MQPSTINLPWLIVKKSTERTGACQSVGRRFRVCRHLGRNVEILLVKEREQFTYVQVVTHFQRKSSFYCLFWSCSLLPATLIPVASSATKHSGPNTFNTSQYQIGRSILKWLWVVPVSLLVGWHMDLSIPTLPLQTSSGKVTLSVCIKQASYTEDCKNVCSLAKAVLDNRLELWKKLQARSLFATLQGKLEKRKKQPWNIQVFCHQWGRTDLEEAGGK